MNILYILGGALILHLILATLSKNSNLHSYVRERFMISWGGDTSLMLAIQQLKTNRMIMIDAFGGQIGFICKSKSTKDSKSESILIGFNSTDGEIFCKELWWYNTFTKKNQYIHMPWDTSQIWVYEKYLNIDTGKLVNKNVSIPVKTITDTNYYTKTGEVQHINKIEFFLIQRCWTSLIGHYLALDHILCSKKVNLVFKITDEADGLGHSNEHIGLISLHKETIDAFNKYTKYSTYENKINLIKLIEERIGYFMMIDKNF